MHLKQGVILEGCLSITIQLISTNIYLLMSYYKPSSPSNADTSKMKSIASVFKELKSHEGGRHPNTSSCENAGPRDRANTGKGRQA